MGTDRDWRGGDSDLPVGALTAAAARLGADIAANLAFFTRLPIPDAGAAPDFRRIAWAAPLAGALVGALGAAILAAGAWLGLPRLVTAALATAAAVVVSGAMHEDALADVADGFGGGATREAKLEIMRDSRLGSYGAAALALALTLRVAALAGALNQGLGFSVSAIVLGAASARTAALAPLAILPPARRDGAGASAARGVEPRHFAQSFVVAFALAVGLGALTLGVTRAIFSLLAGAAAAYGVAALARRQIGGQTGDVAGAAAEIAEIATLVALLMRL